MVKEHMITCIIHDYRISKFIYWRGKKKGSHKYFLSLCNCKQLTTTIYINNTLEQWQALKMEQDFNYSDI